MNCTFCVEKTINTSFTLDFLNRSFFGFGEFCRTHSALCRLVTGLWAKHHVLSPVIIFSKNVLLVPIKEDPGSKQLFVPP
jgi:hypothetical protein